MDAVTAWTSEPELPASFAPEGAPVMEEVPSTPVGSTPMIAMAYPSVGARPSRSLVWLGDDPLVWGRDWLHWAKLLDLSDLVFTLDDPVDVKD